MSYWFIHAFLPCLLWHWSMGQDEQVCHHIDSRDFKYVVQCYGVNASNAYQLTLVMNDVRLKFPNDRMRIQIGNSVGDALPDDVFDGYVIQSVAMNDCGFTSMPFRLITKLPSYFMGLDLNDNLISSIDYQSLNALPYASSLTNLELSSNRIASLPEDAFVNFTALLTLGLKDNLLEALGDNTFRGLVKVHDLYLYGNQIRDVGREAFAGLKRLQLVALDINRIAFLENGTFSAENQTNLFEIPLEGNPFHCNCSLQWLKDYLVSIHYLEFSGATCIYPRIANFQDIDFCSSETADAEIRQHFDTNSIVKEKPDNHINLIQAVLKNKS